ncbi:DAZ-associated protein 1 isoform X4 [Sceloporus undulatus]|uniref:DAZ-associated protein 1 isoform X4 n=1 Tax=Sceloporus undulatus TaxID=8520 RepID=UPI001C4AB69F|nr:DAZ-associated protein 1 isoform X4 [Sceloporus undulatus]
MTQRNSGPEVEVKRAEPRDSKSQTPGPTSTSQWGSRIMPSAANGWAGQPPPTWQQGYGPQGMWVPAGQALGGYGPPPPGRGAPPPPPPFTSYIVSTPPGGFPPPQGFPQGYGTPPPFSFGYGAPPPPPDQFAPPGVPPPPATPGAAPLAFPPPPPPSQPTQDMSKPPTAQPEFPYSQFGQYVSTNSWRAQDPYVTMLFRAAFPNQMQMCSMTTPTHPLARMVIWDGNDGFWRLDPLGVEGKLAGYGQDLSGFGQGFTDPSQQPPSYGGPSVPPSSGPPAGSSGFGRGQNHNVQGFHPYRR